MKLYQIIKLASNFQEASVNIDAITENKNKNNKKIKEKNCLSSIPNRIKDLMNEIGINYQENTDNELKRIVGKDIDYNILQKIINKNKQSFLKYKNNGQNYLFGILKTIVKNEYEECIKKLEIERIEREAEIKKWMEEPKIDYSKIGSYANNSQSNNGVDISAIIDEMYNDNSNIAENENIDCNDINVWEDNENDSLYTLNEDGNKTYKTLALQILYGLNSKNI